MAEPTTPVARDRLSEFDGLGEYAVAELERARADLQVAAEPQIRRFRIDAAHYLRDEVPWQTLRDEVAGSVPTGATTIYYFMAFDSNEEVPDLIRAFFSETKWKGDGQSRDNKKSSAVMYVGSSRKLATRLREHLGFCSRKTYALKLSEWYPAADLPLELVCAIYPLGTTATVIGALEDALWERLQPMYGRKGAR